MSKHGPWLWELVAALAEWPRAWLMAAARRLAIVGLRQEQDAGAQTTLGSAATQGD